jgi:ankyrin repeat protein
MIKSLIFIRNQTYEPEIFNSNLIRNLGIYTIFYENSTILNYITNIKINDANILDVYKILLSSISYNNYRVINISIKKDKIQECFTIKSFSSGNTLLHEAIYKIKLIILNKFLLHPNIYVCFNIQNNEGYTPLHLAIANSELKIIKELLKTSKIYNSFIIRDNSGNTPLLVAIKNKIKIDKIEIIKELMGHFKISDSYNIKDNDNNTPIELALQLLNLDIKQFENKYKENFSCNILHQAIHNNNIDFVEELLKKPKIEDCFINEDIDTILHIAIQSGFIDIIKLLLKHTKIDICFTIKNKNGYTPLQYALYSGMLDIFYLLLQHPNIKNSFIIKDIDENTILHNAIRKPLNVLEKLLIVDGIETTFIVQNNEGNTPLHLAMGGYVSKSNLEALLKHKHINISYNIKNNNNITPLMIATTNNIKL